MSNATLTRFLPPNGKAATISANGRTYSAAANSFVDVPTGDLWLPAANGWVQVEGAGATAARPSGPRLGQKYLDTTLAATIVWNGVNWANPATGASA